MMRSAGLALCFRTTRRGQGVRKNEVVFTKGARGKTATWPRPPARVIASSDDDRLRARRRRRRFRARCRNIGQSNTSIHHHKRRVPHTVQYACVREHSTTYRSPTLRPSYRSRIPSEFVNSRSCFYSCSRNNARGCGRSARAWPRKARIPRARQRRRMCKWDARERVAECRRRARAGATCHDLKLARRARRKKKNQRRFSQISLLISVYRRRPISKKYNRAPIWYSTKCDA